MIDKQLLIDAENGKAEAQSYLGYKYIKDKDTVQDFKKAYFWIHKAAQQEYPLAQYNLGYMYKTGKGVSVDYTKAISWFTKSSEQGFAPAQCHLGQMHINGVGVDTDFEEAFIWFSIAAEQGDAGAQCGLGRMYIDGYDGFPKSLKDAAYWLNLSCKQGNKVAKELWNYFKLWNYVDEQYK